MDEDMDFAARIRERYPEGLTGLVAIGGTRTTYILERNRHLDNPGHIDDFSHYGDYILDRYFDFVDMYMSLGGQNLVITALGYQSFHERGEKYSAFIAESTWKLAGDRAQKYYRETDTDPYFVGIDTLLHLPPTNPAHRLGEQLAEFQNNWNYQEGRRKVIWEIASIPLFSFHKAQQTMGAAASAELETALSAATDLNTMYRLLNNFYSRAAYHTEIPVPHFYLASNRNGDIKLRSVLPTSLLVGDPCRFYYTPYPSLFIKRETFQAILNDLAFGKLLLRSTEMDYREKFTAELAESVYQHFLELSANTDSVVGLTRSVTIVPSED